MLLPALLSVALVATPTAADADAARLEAGARAYVAALVDHDPAGVPLHPRAVRFEEGVQTGFSGPQIRFDLRFGPQYRVINGVRDERYTVTGDVVTADYVLDVGAPGVPLTTARVHETFAFDGGRIATIVAEITL